MAKGREIRCRAGPVSGVRLSSLRLRTLAGYVLKVYVKFLSSSLPYLFFEGDIWSSRN